MVWRDDKRDTGSLDGKKFQYEESGQELGADGVVHFIATSGRPVYEGVSEGVDIFPVDAYFVGDDYLSDKQDFIDILKKPTTHQFVHPTQGRFKVALLGRARVTETNKEGGVCRFTFRLIVVEDPAFPLIIDSGAGIDLQVDALNLALIAAYSARFKLGAFAKKILGAIGLATAAMRVVEGKIQAIMNISESFGDAVSGFADQAASLLRKPEDMITSMAGTALNIMATINEAKDDLQDRSGRSQSAFLQGMNLIFEQERPEEAFSPTPESDLEQNNAIEFWLANRVTFLGAAASSVTDMVFESSSEVETFKASFLTFFEDVSLDANLDDQLYSEIRQLKAQVVRYLSEVAQNLPEITTFTTAKALPALVVAYMIYEDPERDQEIVSRNDVTHPMYVPPRTLEVISSV